MRNRIVTGVFWLASVKAIGQIVTWIVSIVVVRLLSPQDYGLMGMAVLFISFLFLFNELGLGAAMIRKLDLPREQIASLRYLIFGVNFALFLGVLAAAPLVAGYFNEPGLVPIIRVIGSAFVLNGIGLPSSYLLQRDMAFKQKAAAELIGHLAGGLSTLTFAMLGFGVWSLVFGYLVLQSTMNLMYCVYSPPSGFRFSFRGVGEFVSLGSQVALSRVLWYVSSNADFLIVGRVLGTVQLGFYSLAFQFSALPLEKVVTLITQVAYPSFTTMQNDDERLRKSYLEVVSAVALVTFPIFLGIFLVANDAVALFLTTKWQPVVLPLQLLCIASCFRAVENLNAPLILAKGQPGVLTRNSLLQAAVMPVSFYIGAQYGLVGVAMSWLVTRPALFVIMTVWTGRVVGLSFWRYLGGLRHAVAGSTLMVVVVLLVRRFALSGATAAVDFTITCILGVLVYSAYNVAFNQVDVQKALDLVRQRRVRRAAERAVPVIEGETDTHVAFSRQ